MAEIEGLLAIIERLIFEAEFYEEELPALIRDRIADLRVEVEALKERLG